MGLINLADKHKIHIKIIIAVIIGLVIVSLICILSTSFEKNDLPEKKEALSTIKIENAGQKPADGISTVEITTKLSSNEWNGLTEEERIIKANIIYEEYENAGAFRGITGTGDNFFVVGNSKEGDLMFSKPKGSEPFVFRAAGQEQ